jgi:hypothetical protein
MRFTHRLALLPLAALAALAAACAPKPPAEIVPAEKPVAIRGVDQPLKPGECGEALRRALENPEMVVDRLASPLSMKPALFQRAPKGVFRKDGSMELKVDVVVDTLGRADMATFKVVAASHDWFVRNARTVIPRWKFEPAQVVGCKVPRVYKLMVSVPARAKARKG